MAVTQFKDVSWGNEPLDTNKLNTMVSNTRYLFERAPKLYYNAYNTKKDTGIKIGCGQVLMPAAPGAYSTAANAYFGSFFTPGCYPVIAVSIVSNGSNKRLSIIINGLSGGASIPDYTGMRVECWQNEFTNYINDISRAFYVNYIAMGY